jgi:TrmH family RNA methyltransferase
MIQTLNSLKNETVKKAASLKQKKFRQREGLFIVEGTRAVDEVRHSDWDIAAYFFIELPEGWEEEAASSTIPYYQVSQAVMEKITATENPQPLAVLVRINEARLDDFQPRDGLVLVLDEIRDPGNVGTMIRTACAAGAKGVILLRDSVDLYNPKVVRSTMGNLFHLPVFSGVSEEELLAWAGKNNWSLVATDLKKAVELPDFVWPQKTLLLMGSEAEGVSESLLEKAGVRLRIPMYGPAESLNVAVAAGILLFSCAVHQHHEKSL